MPGPAIVSEQLRRRFGDFDAVAGVDLEVGQGEIYGFLGPNGAGKSTMVKMLCTLLRPTGGVARVAGFDVERQSHEVRLHIGAALQETALDPKLTGRETLSLQGRYYGLRRGEIDQRLSEVLGMVDIGDAIDRQTGTYSGGMRRRLDLAAALMHNPEVLFLDEPTTGLDPVSRARVWDEVRRLNVDLGVTIFLTTQYLEEADELAGRVAIINDGVIVAEGTPDELKRRIGSDVIVVRVAGDVERARAAVQGVDGVDAVTVPPTPSTTSAESTASTGSADGGAPTTGPAGGVLTISVSNGAASISPVAVALNDCGVTVEELALRTPTLDDVFLELTGGHIQHDEDAVPASNAPGGRP